MILLYNTSEILVKILLLLQYRRIPETPRKNRMCYIALAFISVYELWDISSAILACILIQAYWAPAYRTRKVLLDLNILVYYLELEKHDRDRNFHPSTADLAQAAIDFKARGNNNVYFHH